MLALSVAAVLAVFLLYVSIAGGRTAQVKPSQLAGHTENVNLVGRVVGQARGTATRTPGLRFEVGDIKGSGARVPSSITAASRISSRLGRDVVVWGRFANGVFVAKRDTLVTKCPSKYSPKKA